MVTKYIAFIGLVALVHGIEAGRPRNVFPAHAQCQPENSNCARVFTGCNAHGGHCWCDRAFCCRNPFKYENLASCLLHNKPSADPCKPNPCKHDGYCVQVGQTGFRCLCQQTGYYGQHCHERCPSSEEVSKVFKTMWKSNNRKLMRKLLPCVLF
ncbi:adhesive plaque matrix protein 2 [Nematostella vectensis]|uniref:adhesive plaque matrix protein 2 n=1 Tax=Nematostella vectensis TaxID=45351 RepID=UPI00138FA4DE|nr:adhesive plaque matrix protein 2 [Nematostella vectensis]